MFLLSSDDAVPIPETVTILAVAPTEHYNWPMFVQASTEALLALNLFQLDPTRRKNRKILNQQLVQVAMFEHEDARSLNEITTAVSEVLGQAAEFSHDECREALHDNCLIGRISQLGEDTYILPKKTREKLSEHIEKFKESEKEFDRGLANSVGRSLNRVLNPFAEAILCNSVKEVIQGIFYEHALKLRRLLDEPGDFSILLEVNSDAESNLKQRLETFLSLQPDAAIGETMDGVRRFLGNLNKAQKHYIANLHYKVFYFQILNVDPRLQELEDECFKHTRLYLDTNVVMSYLCEGHAAHQAVFDILNMSKALGIKFFISSKTLQESERLVEEARAFSPHLDRHAITAILQVNPTAINNPIIGSFLVKRQKNPRINWAGFLSPFSELEIYLMTHDIEVSDDKCSDITTDEAYSRVHVAITDAKAEDTPLSIIDHDTYNLILVQQLRNTYPGTPLGSSVWLITIDRRLPKADRILRRKYPNPHCRLIEHWGAVLLPFQNVGRLMATDEYVSWLISQELGATFPEEVFDLRFVRELEDADIGLDDFLGLDPEIAFRSLTDLQEDRQTKALLAQIPSSPDDEKESIKSEFRKGVLSVISKRGQEDVEQDKREITRLQNGIHDLSERLREMESAKTKDAEKLELLKQKLEAVKAELNQYGSMPFWQRVKYVLGGRRK